MFYFAERFLQKLSSIHLVKCFRTKPTSIKKLWLTVKIKHNILNPKTKHKTTKKAIIANPEPTRIKNVTTRTS